MKTIPNKRTTIEVIGKEAEFLDYAYLMRQVITWIKPEGFAVEEMRKDFRVLDALENVDGEIKLEDADFEHFKIKMKIMRWNKPHKDLIKFEDDINAIK